MLQKSPHDNQYDVVLYVHPIRMVRCVQPLILYQHFRPVWFKSTMLMWLSLLQLSSLRSQASQFHVSLLPFASFFLSNPPFGLLCLTITFLFLLLFFSMATHSRDQVDVPALPVGTVVGGSSGSNMMPEGSSAAAAVSRFEVLDRLDRNDESRYADLFEVHQFISMFLYG